MHLQLSGISKYFRGVKALESVNFELREGEVHALCGENGAGKSTLMNILTGNLTPDAGEIILNQKTVEIRGPAHAGQLGIAIVYQQLSLVETLSVAENIFANTQPHNRLGFIQYNALYTQAKNLLESLLIGYIHADKLVGELSPGEKQMVEIAKALSKNPKILILDEPTASISERETATLFNLIGQLREQGKSVIYISHRMAEIFRIADRVSVLKDGQYQGTRETKNLTSGELIRLMVGRDLIRQKHDEQLQGVELLRVENLSGNRFEDVSFAIHKGEILGFAGLIGAGRTEIAQTIFGVQPRKSGQIFLKGSAVTIDHPAQAIASGIGYVPEERKSEGLFLEKSVIDNILVSYLQTLKDRSVYDETVAVAMAEVQQRALRIVSHELSQPVFNLSGGNQQKVVLAKWLLTDPEILIVDEPTHGIDIGAKSEIYDLLRTLASAGKGIIVISSELPELLGLADRILVVRDGKISGELNGRDTTEEEVTSLAMA